MPFIGPDEVPPPYQQGTAGGVPMVTCRVCQSMIDITSKRDQHVVKCLQCNEATVRKIVLFNTNQKINDFLYFTANT